MQKTAHMETRAVISITNMHDGKRVEELLSENNLPIFYQCRAKGTAPSEMLDILGFGGTSRLITITLVQKQRIKEIFKVLTKELFYHQRGGGIAFSIPVTGAQSSVYECLKQDCPQNEGNENHMDNNQKNSDFTLIWVSVDSGFCDDVIDAARQAGARGGTVLKGVRHASDDTIQALGVATQSEQDFVMIVAEKSLKAQIMSAVSQKCGLMTDAHGIVLALPVEDAMGLQPGI